MMETRSDELHDSRRRAARWMWSIRTAGTHFLHTWLTDVTKCACKKCCHASFWIINTLLSINLLWNHHKDICDPDNCLCFMTLSATLVSILLSLAQGSAGAAKPIWPLKLVHFICSSAPKKPFSFISSGVFFTKDCFYSGSKSWSSSENKSVWLRSF